MSISLANMNTIFSPEDRATIDRRTMELPEQMRERQRAPERRGLCLVIVAPSGCGKTSIMEALLKADLGLKRSVSATTRPPREGEREGIHYFFKTHGEFEALVASGGMLEHALVHRNSYGIPKAPVEDALERGQDIVFVVDWQGHRTMCDNLPGDVVGIFLLPPSMEELERRLRGRGDPDEDIGFRLKQAVGEVLHWDEFPYVVVNDDLAKATSKVAAILEAERHASGRSVAARCLVAELSFGRGSSNMAFKA